MASNKTKFGRMTEGILLQDFARDLNLPSGARDRLQLHLRNDELIVPVLVLANNDQRGLKGSCQLVGTRRLVRDAPPSSSLPGVATAALVVIIPVDDCALLCSMARFAPIPQIGFGRTAMGYNTLVTSTVTVAASGPVAAVDPLFLAQVGVAVAAVEVHIGLLAHVRGVV
ncbi:hypothetical protein PG996_008503 [Apiospora saccharicola]|uniref:Uncharacterized protein n=1 Tax=Apiospora saccharicola TaxID=335842 RepID=A0ABR1UY40_9PEZI